MITVVSFNILDCLSVYSSRAQKIKYFEQEIHVTIVDSKIRESSTKKRTCE